MDAAALTELLTRLSGTWVQDALTGAPSATGAGDVLLETLASEGRQHLDTLTSDPYAAARLLIQRQLPELADQIADRRGHLEDEWLLLAYGTLKEGEPVVGGEAVPRTTTVLTGARVPGSIYDLGAYPGAVVDHAATLGSRVVSSTFEADLLRIAEPDVAGALAAYDRYEDVDYRRVFVPSGRPRASGAWVYDWTGPTDQLTRIVSGRWSARA